MDSRGWIPISLIASFNRVKSLTVDERLVKDVLILSSIVDVKDDWVRMGGNQWRQFVLPDAPASTVELLEGDAEVEGDVEDEDDDDVVFVMSQEDSWAAGRRQT